VFRINKTFSTVTRTIKISFLLTFRWPVVSHRLWVQDIADIKLCLDHQCVGYVDLIVALDNSRYEPRQGLMEINKSVLKSKPTKFTLIILIFLFLRRLLHVSNPMVHVQEAVCTYKCGIVVYMQPCKKSAYTVACKQISLFISLHINKLYHTWKYDYLPGDEPSGSTRVEDIVIIKILV
jgi:hypothetical protein